MNIRDRIKNAVFIPAPASSTKSATDSSPPVNLAVLLASVATIRIYTSGHPAQWRFAVIDRDRREIRELGGQLASAGQYRLLQRLGDYVGERTMRGLDAPEILEQRHRSAELPWQTLTWETAVRIVEMGERVTGERAPAGESSTNVAAPVGGPASEGKKTASGRGAKKGEAVATVEEGDY